MSQEFMDYVAQWENLAEQIENVKRDLKVLTDKEMVMRKALASSVGAALGANRKEGVNDYTLPDGRTLKYTYSVERKIEEAEIANARIAHRELNDTKADFDRLLRVKYELDKKEWNRIETEAEQRAVSRMIVAKESAPKLEIV